MHRLSIRADEHGRRRCLRLRHSLRWLQPRLLQEPVRRGCAGVRMHPVPCRLLLHGRSLPYLGHLSSRNVSFSIFLLSPPPTLPFQKKQGCAITYWAGRFGTRPSQTPQCTAALGLRATFEGFLLHPGFTLDSAKKWRECTSSFILLRTTVPASVYCLRIFQFAYGREQRTACCG